MTSPTILGYPYRTAEFELGGPPSVSPPSAARARPFMVFGTFEDGVRQMYFILLCAKAARIYGGTWEDER